MNVKLIHYSDNADLLDNIHTRRLLSFNYYITGVSRALNQQVCRSRSFSFSIRSSRYTLSKDLKNEQPFNGIEDVVRAEKYIVLTNNPLVDAYSIQALENTRLLVKEGISNDILKYAMPECYKTDLALSTNFDGLENFLKLRTSNHALWEIRDLAYAMYDVLPDNIKVFLKDSIYPKDK